MARSDSSPLPVASMCECVRGTGVGVNLLNVSVLSVVEDEVVARRFLARRTSSARRAKRFARHRLLVPPGNMNESRVQSQRKGPASSCTHACTPTYQSG